MSEKNETRKKNYFLLALFLKNQVTEIFKRMARDEDLFRFLSDNIDPLRLVDHQLQMDKACLDLAFKAEEESIDTSSLKPGIEKYAEKFGRGFFEIYEGVAKGSDIITERLSDLLLERLSFYRQFLSSESSVENVLELAQESFESADHFEIFLKKVLEGSRFFGLEVIKQTDSLHRFLMQKQLQLEEEHAKEIWMEFQLSAFPITRELP